MATLQGLQGWCFWVLFLFFNPNPQDDFWVLNTAKQNSDYRTNMCLDRLNGFDEALWWWCSVEYVFLSCLKKFNNSRWWCQVQEHGTECHQLPERSREAARRQTTNHQLCRCWAHVLGDSATRSTNNEERLMNHLLLDLLAGSRGVGWIPMIWEWSNQWIDLSKKLQETTFFF